MKKTKLFATLFFTVLVGVTFLGCANVINGTTKLVVQNDTSTPITFTVSDSVSGKVYGTHRIVNGTNESYVVEKGYVKSTPTPDTPMLCEWQFENGVWKIKELLPYSLSATNKLSVEVTLEAINLNYTVPAVTISANDTGTLSGLYPRQLYQYELRGQAKDSFGRTYVGTSDRIYFEIVLSSNTLSINPK